MGIRCFVAVELPDELREEIVRKTEGLRNTSADVRWVESDNLHLTLKFLGDVPEGRLGDIENAICEAAQNVGKFRARFGGLGMFPSQKRPRVIWIGLTEGGEEFRLLQACVEKALASFGFVAEEREFMAHLTLGRLRTPRGAHALLKKLDELAGVDFGGLEVRSISLMRSDLSPKGSKYFRLAEIGLGGATPTFENLKY